MRSSARKARRRVVVEFRTLPLSCRVARRTILGEVGRGVIGLYRLVVISLVTRHTCGRNRSEAAILVAARAVDRSMPSR